jgi:hypothetical protein
MNKVIDFLKKFKIPAITMSFGLLIIVLAMFSPTWGNKTIAESEFPTVSSSESDRVKSDASGSLGDTATVSCYVGSTASSNDCPSFPHTGNIKIKITLTEYSAESDSIDVAFAEDLANYEDAYYDFESGNWNCESNTSVSGAHKRTLTPQNPTYETTINVEAKHKVALTHYTVHDVYATGWGHSSADVVLEVTYTQV